MKDFKDFQEYVRDNTEEILDEIQRNLKDVSESQRTVSKEEWIFIEKFVIKANIAMLRQYHEWLLQDYH